ncbi:hypothetical protein [Novosphingobium sp. 9]|uniref:hypothetical protein n=1 Tax=Novosphingobium sp. 9 TaxID=2025349 RepID=UPI0021B52970|nr:hypothetical protein [Novosphingobium sp. 9]
MIRASLRLRRFAAARSLPILSMAASSLLLAGCVANSSYPSLAQRPIERIDNSLTPAPDTAPTPPAPPPASSDLTTRLAGLVKYAKDSDSQFQTLRADADRKISAASGTSLGSDSWGNAQVAMAQLDSARGGASSAMADLDALYSDARDHTPVGDTPSLQAIIAARETVLGIVTAENAAVDSLSRRLKG